MTPIHQQLVDARAQMGITQAEFARRVGKPKHYINDLEAGRKEVSFSMVQSLLEKVGFTLEAHYTLTRNAPE